MIEEWVINLAYGDQKFNENNSRCYVDMVNDMTDMNNGVFSCTIKIDNGDICDYVAMENDTYVKPRA